MSDLKLFLTSWPNGTLRPVKTLGPHPSIRGGIYIRYLDEEGGTDTTTDDFLFDMPDLTYPKEQVDELIEAIQKLPVEDWVQEGPHGESELVGYVMQAQGEWDDVKSKLMAIAQLQANGTGEGI